MSDMNEYLCTLADALADVKSDTAVGSLTASETAYLLDAIRKASARITERLGVPFEPWHETRAQDATYDPVTAEGDVLMLDWPLLAVTEITLGDGTVLDSDEFGTSPTRGYAIEEIYLTTMAYSFFALGTRETRRGAIAIEGVWGVRRDYAKAWQAITTITAGVNASVTTVPLASAVAVSPGALLRIGSEYMRVTAVSGNNATVTRACNGTTAAAHDNGAAVSVWSWQPEIRDACSKLAAYYHQRRGSFEASTFDMGAGVVVRYPADIPPEVENVLREFPVPTRGA